MNTNEQLERNQRMSEDPNALPGLKPIQDKKQNSQDTDDNKIRVEDNQYVLMKSQDGTYYNLVFGGAGMSNSQIQDLVSTLQKEGKLPANANVVPGVLPDAPTDEMKDLGHNERSTRIGDYTFTTTDGTNHTIKDTYNNIVAVPDAIIGEMKDLGHNERTTRIGDYTFTTTDGTNYTIKDTDNNILAAPDTIIGEVKELEENKKISEDPETYPELKSNHDEPNLEPDPKPFNGDDVDFSQGLYEKEHKMPEIKPESVNELKELISSLIQEQLEETENKDKLSNGRKI